MKEDETKQVEAYAIFNSVLDKLEEDGFDLTWSRKGIADGSAKLVVIDIPEEHDNKENKRVVRTMATVFVGYMFCTSHQDKYPLSADVVLKNYDELIIKKNKVLLIFLYTRELEKRKRPIRNAKDN